MRVFLTGATGFVGRHLAAALRARGDVVRALVRPGSDARSLEASGVELVRGDVVDEQAVRRAAEGCDVLYHLAVPVRSAPLRVHHAVNVLGTEIVLHAARAAGASHVVHASTVGVHGRLCRVPADESHPLRPQTSYQTTRLEGERRVLGHVRAHGISAVIARFTSLYGPGDLRSLKVFRSVLRGRVLTVGSARRPADLTYVDDAVQGLMRCGEVRGAAGACYVIGSDHPRPIADFFQAIADAADVRLRLISLPALPLRIAEVACRALLPPLAFRSRVLHRLDHALSPKAFDTSKAKRELGYRPRVSLEEGARRTLAWYLANGYLETSRR